ncbi:two-component sensor histidine kinase [Komagataeibacter rhaeticus]|uniref:histidine kinase n=1 Tax=Komagataeibacter rhaeticus TaxID=215221 RepID=A0A858JCM4_9PROT|nr:ATP-binding protein [Komagataeibacter rhaeticus]ATU73566.1 two-component sensor histidine kinase [Komagataeibacter xylinus]KDU95318.1 ATPase [Komagataeibacter rhaeticus AF1]MBL7241276.1 PAS domain-containing protein [Komagataeibacter rhaeticus]PYD53995.1 two-component sensor histidine kinase [Komagataeibacter rhaeticus]QIP34605.1 PAS domain-containing protein [Komagataeibacter rhaeticus]
MNAGPSPSGHPPCTPASITGNGRVVLDSLPLPVMVVRADNAIGYVNSAAEPFFGMSRAHLVQMRLTDILPGDSPLFMLMEQVRAQDHTVVEHEVMLESPRLRHEGVTVQGAPVMEEPGSVVLTFHDFSAVRVLDRQLTFRSAARSVAGMAAILAHEVKNPLSGIRGAAQLLETSVGESDRELAVLIQDEVNRIRDLVDRMDMFSDRPIERRPVNIHRVLEHVRRLAQQGFAADIRFEEIYDPSLPPVWGNRDQLVQVLLNLVKNAAEALDTHPEGGEPAQITLTTSYRPGIWVSTGGGQRVQLPLLVSVRDNGPGIPENIRPHLFEPFLTTKATGSGLGLALAGKIVGDHGGVIEVESRPGRTEVLLHLPVVTEERGAP